MTNQMARLKKLLAALKSMEEMNMLALSRLESEVSKLKVEKEDLFRAADQIVPLLGTGRSLHRRVVKLETRVREVQRLIGEANRKLLRARALQNSVQGKLLMLRSDREKLDLAETLQDHVSHSLGRKAS